MDAFINNLLIDLSLLPLFAVFVVSLYVLSKGADILIDNAVILSIRWGIPKIIVGATIVSLGTTLPEATVSVFAAMKGNPDLALGNAVGSIIANTGLIVGIAAMLGELPVDQKTINRQGVIQLYSGVLLVIISLPIFSQSPFGTLHQWMGWVLTGMLVVYIYFSIRWSKLGIDPTEVTPKPSRREPFKKQIFLLILGMVMVILASKVLIPTVEISAIRLGIPQGIIAATLVAFGTSLPELITAITAVRKGHGELAVGNIIGADILNVLFVVGLSAAVTKGGLPVPLEFYKLQFPTMILILVLFRIFAKSKDHRISKKEGLLLASLYFIYLLLSFFWL